MVETFRPPDGLLPLQAVAGVVSLCVGVEKGLVPLKSLVHFVLSHPRPRTDKAAETLGRNGVQGVGVGVSTTRFVPAVLFKLHSGPAVIELHHFPVEGKEMVMLCCCVCIPQKSHFDENHINKLLSREVYDKASATMTIKRRGKVPLSDT